MNWSAVVDLCARDRYLGINVGSGNGLVLSGNKPLPKPMARDVPTRNEALHSSRHAPPPPPPTTLPHPRLKHSRCTWKLCYTPTWSAYMPCTNNRWMICRAKMQIVSPFKTFQRRILRKHDVFVFLLFINILNGTDSWNPSSWRTRTRVRLFCHNIGQYWNRELSWL